MVGCVAARNDGVLLVGPVCMCVQVLMSELGAAGSILNGCAGQMETVAADWDK